MVEEVARTHHADVYEMKMEDRPVKTMAEMIPFLDSGGKFLDKFNPDQSSATKEAIRRTGIVSRLL